MTIVIKRELYLLYFSLLYYLGKISFSLYIYILLLNKINNKNIFNKILIFGCRRFNQIFKLKYLILKYVLLCGQI